MLKIGIIKHKNPNGGPQIFLYKLSEALKKENYVKIRDARLPFFDIGLYNSVAKNIYQKPYILRLDGIYYNLALGIKKSKKLNQPIFESILNARGLIFQSQFSKKLIEAHFGEIKKPFTIIHNGALIINRQLFNRKDLGLPEDKIIIIASAKWRRWKRLKEIVEVFLEAKKIEKNLFLAILGSNPDYVIHRDDIKYFGNIQLDILPYYYRNSDLMIHLAWLDNCPNTVVECIASGTPVLCSNQGGTKELIELTKGGIISEADPDFNFDYVNLNAPPKINLTNLLNDFYFLIKNKDLIKKNMLKEKLNIKNISKSYIEFINQIKSN